MYRLFAAGALLLLANPVLAQSAPRPGKHKAASKKSARPALPPGSTVSADGRLVKLGAEADFDGVRLSPASQVLLHPNGRLAEGTLSADQTLQGVPAAKGSRAQFDEEGRVVRALLAAPLKSLGVELPAGSEILVHRYGELLTQVMRARDVDPEAKGKPTRQLAGKAVGVGEKELSVPGEAWGFALPVGARVGFNDISRVHFVQFPEQAPGHGLFARLDFDWRTGRIEAAELARPVKVGRRKAPAGALLHFDASGRIEIAQDQ